MTTQAAPRREMRSVIGLGKVRLAPAEIHVPAATAVILVITNADDTSEEFDSAALRIEKVLQGGQKGSVWLRPLTAGTYPFMGEFHADTAKGAIIAE